MSTIGTILIPDGYTTPPGEVPPGGEITSAVFDNIDDWVAFFDSTPEVTVNDRVIWEGVVYKNRTGAVTATTPILDITNWSVAEDNAVAFELIHVSNNTTLESNYNYHIEIPGAELNLPDNPNIGDKIQIKNKSGFSFKLFSSAIGNWKIIGFGQQSPASNETRRPLTVSDSPDSHVSLECVSSETWLVTSYYGMRQYFDLTEQIDLLYTGSLDSWDGTIGSSVIRDDGLTGADMKGNVYGSLEFAEPLEPTLSDACFDFKNNDIDDVGISVSGENISMSLFCMSVLYQPAVKDLDGAWHSIYQKDSHSYLEVYGNKLYGRVYDIGFSGTLWETELVAGTTYKLDFKYNGIELSFWVDDVKVFAMASTVIIDGLPTNSIRLGYFGTLGTEPLYGKIQNFQIIPHAISDITIPSINSNLTISDSNTIYYDMSNIVALNVVDSSGNGNDGTIDDECEVKSYKDLSWGVLKTLNDSGIITPLTELDFQSSFTVCSAFKLANNLNTTNYIFGSREFYEEDSIWKNKQLGLTIRGSGYFQMVVRDDSIDVYEQTGVTLSEFAPCQWYHFALRYDSVTKVMDAIVDGKIISTINIDMSQFTLLGPFSAFGYLDRSNEGECSGEHKNFRFYNTNKSLSDIASIKRYDTPTRLPELVNKYNFEDNTYEGTSLHSNINVEYDCTGFNNIVSNVDVSSGENKAYFNNEMVEFNTNLELGRTYSLCFVIDMQSLPNSFPILSGLSNYYISFINENELRLYRNNSFGMSQSVTFNWSGIDWTTSQLVSITEGRDGTSQTVSLYIGGNFISSETLATDVVVTIDQLGVVDGAIPQFSLHNIEFYDIELSEFFIKELNDQLWL